MLRRQLEFAVEPTRRYRVSFQASPTEEDTTARLNIVLAKGRSASRLRWPVEMRGYGWAATMVDGDLVDRKDPARVPIAAGASSSEVVINELAYHAGLYAPGGSRS